MYGGMQKESCLFSVTGNGPKKATSQNRCQSLRVFLNILSLRILSPVLIKIYIPLIKKTPNAKLVIKCTQAKKLTSFIKQNLSVVIAC